MKVMKYFAVASLALFAACNNEENPVVPESGNQPVDVVVALNTTQVGTRAAMGDLQGKVEDQAAASLEKVHVYLTDNNGGIIVAEEFVKDDANWAKLVNATAISATANPGGYKFKNVNNDAKTAVVICNPQGAIATEKTNISAIADYALKPQISEVIYADAKDLTLLNQEPYGVDPQQEQRTVKGAEFTLAGNMNRFQVLGTKFNKIEWIQNGKEAAKTWQTEWLKQNTGKTEADALAAFVANVGTYDVKIGKSPKETEWKKYFQVVDVTAENTGIVMNRFYNKFHVADRSSNGLMQAKTYAGGRYDFANGTFKPDVNTDLSAVASYYNAAGFTFDGKKAAAFNFFTDKVTNYGKNGDAPTLHFIFKDGKVSADRRFFNVTAYTATEGQTTGLDATANKAGKLLNIDLSAVNGGNGILVDVDPTIPEGVTPEPDGKEDFDSENVNVIVRVQVQPWTAVNVFPILD
ncbi:hypothetical protein ACTNAN_10975 [Phocaeicola vulgatus]|uniref:hypothetical protein n=1 Tax=Phocaeicola vulgatus TaxID=821 RepID=UPI0039B69867